MELGQCQARLLGHPPQQSSTTTPETSRGDDIDPRFAHLLRLGAAYHRLRRFIASEMGRHSSGLYVRAFCRELAIIADEYGRDVLGLGDQPGRRPPAPELELRMSRHLRTMPVLDRLVEEHASCLGGPALLNSLHRASACGDEEVQRVVSRQPPAFCPQEEAESLTLSSLVCLHVGVVGEGRLQKACHAVLFRYIAAWSAHGRLLDSHNEFFIRPSYTASGQQEDVFLDEPLVPLYLGMNLCRQILFIGKACQLFTQSSDMDETWKDDAKLLSTHLSYLSNAESFDLRALEDTIQMTNRSMTSHFSRWLLHHADLPAHLNVLREFFLLGNGEFYHRFLEHAQPLFSLLPSEETEREANKLWQEALLTTCSLEHETKSSSTLVEIRPVIPRSKSDSNLYLKWDDMRLSCSFVSGTGMTMLFTEDTIDRYNEIFRFLMRLRRVQMDLERVWIAQKRWKTDSSEQSANRQEQHSMRLTSILRLEMAFFADGLMRYAQDVVEVEFEEMLGKLSREAEGGTDVEEVVILHDGFLRKLSAYCAFSQIPSVHASLTQLFSLIEAFASFATTCDRPTPAHAPRLTTFAKAFRKHQDFVVDVLTGLIGLGHNYKGRTSSERHFAGLLLRFQRASPSSLFCS